MSGEGTGKGAVESLSASDKLLRAARLAGGHLPAHMRKDFAALFAPGTLAITTAVLGGWAASHALGVGFAADVVLLVVGVVALGLVAFQVVDELVAFTKGAVGARTEANLDAAAEHLATAVSLVGVQVFVALITRGAVKRVQTQGLPQVRAARLDRILKAVRAKTEDPGVRHRVYEALGFLEEAFPKLGEKGIVSRLQDIDFYRPVEVVTLERGTKLIAWRQCEYILYPDRLAAGLGPVRRFEPLLQGQYYSVPGTPPWRLGVSSAGRELVRYQVLEPVRVLKSIAAGTKDGHSAARHRTFGHLQSPGGLVDTAELVGGGGTQFILPEPDPRKLLLEVIEIAAPKL